MESLLSFSTLLMNFLLEDNGKNHNERLFLLKKSTWAWMGVGFHGGVEGMIIK